MFACVNRPAEQKDLYFVLNKYFTLEQDETKYSGIYALFKNDLCLYVGQSSNIASRLATHLSGKYKNIDRIFIFDGHSKNNLDESEEYAIQFFKPIENVLADYTKKVNIDNIIDCFRDYENGAPLFKSYEMLVNNYYVFICNDEIALNFFEFKGMELYISDAIKMGAGL